MMVSVSVLTEPTRIGEDLLAIPWSPWKTAAEVVGEINENAITAFGHWDLDGNGPNLIPTKAHRIVIVYDFPGSDCIP